MAAVSAAGATNIKVTSIKGFDVGQTIFIDTGANRESAVIASVGTAGATSMTTETSLGTNEILVPSVNGIAEGETITIDAGANAETAVVASTSSWGESRITLAQPLTMAHPAGTPISGTGITLNAPLARAHAIGAPITDNLPTPGAPNRFADRMQ